MTVPNQEPLPLLIVCMQDPKLLSHPLVSPTYLKDFTGLCQAGMLVVAGGAELMRRDIQAFAAKAAAAAAAAVGPVTQAPAAPQDSPAAAAAAAKGAVHPVAKAPAAPEASAAAALRQSDGTDGDSAEHAIGTSNVGKSSAAADTAAINSSSSSIGGSSGTSGSGLQVVYHEEPCEPHVYPMLALPHLLQKGLVVPRFVAAVVKGESLERVGRTSSADATA